MEPTAPPDDLARRAYADALALLARGDLAGWRAALDGAGGEGARHRRYGARKAALAGGLDGARRATAAAAPPRLLTVAEGAVALLEDEPREPVFLNAAGLALYELGAWRGAEALFDAAHRLSPAVGHVASNRDAARARRREGAAAPRLAPAAAAARRDLERRAARCAERAQPAAGMTISLCMIVRDEEEMLPRSLAAAREAVDEIVVVDTGSVDRTIAIARSFGARVLERPWTGSFADARNAALDAATGDWLLVLDADEVLCEGDAPRLRALAGRVWREAFYLVEINHTGEIGDGTAVTHNTLRMFRNRPEHRYEGRIHEQIAHALPANLPERIELSAVRIDHFGYLGVARDAKDKGRRNLELLLSQRDEGDDSAFLHFNLGSEYAVAGDDEQALAEFERAWELLRDDPERHAYGYLPPLAGRLVRALRLTGRAAEAIALADEALAILPGFTDVVLEQALAARALGDEERAAELLERCLQMGDAPARYSATTGAGSYLALVALADLRRAAGDVPAAVALMRRCLAEHPGYTGAVAPYADALLAGGAEPAAVEAAVAEMLDEPGPSARFLLAVALYEAGHPQAAEPHLRAVVAAQPRNAGARVALAECLLSQRRWEEAAEAAAAVPAGDPRAGAARRTELFARIVAADLDAAQRVASEAGDDLPAGELTAYRAWASSAAGAGGGQLPADAAIPLAIALEALLRVREVDAAGPLVALLERSALAARDRRELLAGIYLRRGFYESAADEWVAACQEHGVDARALTGLARVARARGMLDDALTLAREASALDAGCATAAAFAAELEGALATQAGGALEATP
jgi:tetratricopeptide (TPR) repeat protein